MRPIALALLALTAFASGAQAQQCHPLTRAFSLDLTPLGRDDRYGIALTVNDKPVTFLLDTGGALTQVAEPLAASMGLRKEESRVRMYNMYGGVAQQQVTVDLGVGPLKAKAQELPLIPLEGIDGIFAPDMMQGYDIDIDFAGRKLNYILTDHCDGKVIYWNTPIVSVVPYHGWSRNSDTHMNIPVKIDGHPLTAILDTGATGTTLDADSARQLLGATADAAGAQVTSTAGNGQKVFRWTAKTLEIGGITVKEPKLRILPNLMGKGDKDDIAADSHIRRVTDGMAPSMLIGMDVLRTLRLYVASKEGKLYVTPAGDQVTTPGAAAATAASAPH